MTSEAQAVRETKAPAATIAVPEFFKSGETIPAIGADVSEIADDLIALDVVAFLNKRAPKRGIVARLRLTVDEAYELASELRGAAQKVSEREWPE